MCGFVGAFAADGQLPSKERIADALDLLKKRGPDDSGIWEDGHVRLGHRRLAIVDLRATGHQPMVCGNGRYVIVFNGEIYNHLQLRTQLNPPGGWRGTSDTETLLEAYRAWGAACVRRLNGMFAFAIWDRDEQRLLLARDRLGVKPLYYSWRNGWLSFASRPAALRVLDAHANGGMDPQALRLYLELGYIPAPLSFHRGVHKLKPAHMLLCDRHGMRTERYWDFRHIAPDQSLLKRPETDLVEELNELVMSCVRDRLLADVPLGAFLSGGVDSALVVAVMKAVGVSVPRVFTISFAERSHDEGPAASSVARLLGVEQSQEQLSVDSLLDLLPTYIEEFDEPFSDSSAFPTLAVARLASRSVTVALTGDGGDELFGGYHYYRIAQRLTPMLAWSPAVKRGLSGMLGCLPSHRMKLLAGAVGALDPVGLFAYVRSVGKDFGSLVTDDVSDRTTSAESWFAEAAVCFGGDLTSADIGMRLDTAFTLTDDYLQKIDLATMAFSLEARDPLLDYRLVEWAMRLPVQWKLRDRQTKYLLRKVLCRYLPPQHVYRPKMGFSVPVAKWLRGPLREWARDLIHDDDLLQRLPLRKERLRRLFTLHDSGARDAHPLLWAILMLLCYVARHERGGELPAIAHAGAIGTRRRGIDARNTPSGYPNPAASTGGVSSPQPLP
jgi:asparagine synthase (glutamine-hydrolysing)